jgi:aminopeptidase N
VLLPQPGISRALSVDRAARVTNVRYAVRLALTADSGLPIRGSMRLEFTLGDASAPLLLDFRPGARGGLEQCRVNGVVVQLSIEHGHVMLPASLLAAGRNEVACEFLAGAAPLNRREGYLYTIFVPARAHEAIPCFDQPDLKARWVLTLDLPPGWRAIANADVASVEPVESGLHDANGAHGSRVSFAETELLPTYLFAFAAGVFAEERLTRDGRAIRMYHRSTDRDLLAANLDAIVDAHAAALGWLEDYTGISYPFGKFDIVLVPDFQFGGMEHPGAIFYNQAALLLPASATRHQLLARANVIAHETAHMWFGDLVTMPWFDDVWLKEVCANFMASKIVNPQFPDIDHDLRFLHAHYPAAYDVDRTAGANPIRQRLDNLADAGSLYGAIVYLKSPVVFRQLEILLGEAPLRAALREYLSTFAFGSASWPQLLAILSRHSAVDLTRWSRDWIDQPGRPRITARVSDADAGVPSVHLQTTDPAGARDLSWPQPIDAGLGYDSTIQHGRVWLDGVCTMRTPSARRPDYVLTNGRGLAYGDCRLDEQSRTWLLAHFSRLPDALTRASAWLTLWDALLSGELVPAALFDLGRRSLAFESSELNVQRTLLDLQRLFWVFYSADERAIEASRIEAALRELLSGAPTRTLKAAVLASLRSIATTPTTIEWLRAVWNGDATVEGLTLAEPDHIELAKELAVRTTGPAARTFIEYQIARTIDPDRRASLRYLSGALSPDSGERQAFFGHVSRAENRTREPWVIEGARWLHHPLRASEAVAMIQPALALTEELARTGDIFLPKRWVDATLAAHGSIEAAAAVRQFLDSRSTGYPHALRRIVLASADYLFRAAARR